VLELLYAHVHREPPRASTRRRDLGPQVDAVLDRGLLKDPDRRWESCAAMVDALDAALTSGAAAAAAETVLMQRPTARRRGRWPVLAVVAAVLVVVMVLGAVAVARGPGRQVAGSLSSDSVRPGETVVVSARGLPANQAGVLRLTTPDRDLAVFRAGPKGEVHQAVLIPAGEATGDHLVQLCWAGSCHDLATLHVRA
jgi:hypothetical protein